MEYQEYFLQRKELYDSFLEYINDEDDNDVIFETFINNLSVDELQEDKEEFKSILYLINEISNHHHRYAGFMHKIERIFLFFQKFIKQTYSNQEIFDIFKNNKRILLFLFKQQIINVDETIVKELPQNKRLIPKFFRFYFTEAGKENLPKYSVYNRSTSRNYNYYFFPEIKSFLSEKEKCRIENFLLKQNLIESFEINRQIGENESYVCQLIREDSIEEFDAYINRTNSSLSSIIPDSIFETNSFLQKNRPSLIEYSAFFGSIQIFQYLRLKSVKLTPSLWLYAIHGNNPEMIHLLEENGVKPSNSNFVECLKESIKCHHNGISNYILNNLMEMNIEINSNNFIANRVAYGFHYHNFEFIQNYDNIQFIFYYACLYDYLPIVKLLLETGQIDLNQKIVFNLLHF